MSNVDENTLTRVYNLEQEVKRLNLLVEELLKLQDKQRNVNQHIFDMFTEIAGTDD